MAAGPVHGSDAARREGLRPCGSALTRWKLRDRAGNRLGRRAFASRGRLSGERASFVVGRDRHSRPRRTIGPAALCKTGMRGLFLA